MCKNTLLLLAKFLKAPDRLSEHEKSSNFGAFFKNDVFSCAFFHPPVFHIFTSALHSKLQFDCKVGASYNFRLYPFSVQEMSEVSLYPSVYAV